MGHTKAKVKIYSTDKTIHESVELLVDTGSTYTWVHSATLESLSIQTKAIKDFRTIEGKIVKRSIGEALIEINDEVVTTIVVFAEPTDAQVLGAYALEGLGMEIDPIAEKVKKADVLLAV